MCHFIIIKRRCMVTPKIKNRDRFSKRVTKSDEDRARHGNGEKEQIQKRQKKREGEKSRIGEIGRGGRFSHVTTPHVRRQIYTRTTRRGGKGREASRRPMGRQSPVTRYSLELLSLSLFPVSLAPSLQGENTTGHRVQDFLFSETHRDLADTLELRRVCSIIEAGGDSGSGNGALKGPQRLICWNKRHGARLFYDSAPRLCRLLVYAHATRPVPPSGSGACDGRG